MEQLRGMSLGQKLYASFGVVGAAFLAAVIVGWLSVGSVSSTVRHGYAKAVLAQAASAAAFNMRISQVQNVASGTRQKNADGSDMHAGDVTAFTQALASIRAGVSGNAEKADVAKVDALFTRWQTFDGQVSKLSAGAGTRAAALRLVNGAANTAGDALSTALGDYASFAQHRADTDSAAAKTSAVVIMGIITAIAFLLSGGIAYGTTRGIKRAVTPVLERLKSLQERDTTELRKGLEQIAQGDLTFEAIPATMPIENVGRDELGQIAAAVNSICESTAASVLAYDQTRESLKGLIGRVQETSMTVSSASQQMASTSDEAGQGSRRDRNRCRRRGGGCGAASADGRAGAPVGRGDRLEGDGGT